MAIMSMTTMTQPPASPSRPSVRLTEFERPAMRKNTNTLRNGSEPAK